MSPASEPFHQQLARATDGIWQAIFELPFVREVGEGTLGIEKFAFFIAEDLLYLDQFARVLAAGAQRAPRAEIQQMFLRHAQSVFAVEEALHTHLAPTLGIDVRATRARDPAPVTMAYTDHILRVAQTGSLAELVAAVLPCYWVYARVGERLARKPPDHPIYRAWIESYEAPEFQQAVHEQLDLIDALAKDENANGRARLQRWFVRSLRYEWMFWDQAYRQAEWPI